MKILNEIAQKSGWTDEHDAFLNSNPSFFAEFFNNLTSVMSGVVDSFLKRTTQFIIEPTDENFNVERDISKFLPTKEQGGKIHYLDPNVVDWFGNVTIKGRLEKITSFVFRFVKNLTHYEIISTGEKLKNYKRYNLFDAFALIQKLIDAGEIEEKGKGVFIYLEEEHDRNKCGFYVYRNGNGICLFAYEIKLVHDWCSGCGVLFS